MAKFACVVFEVKDDERLVTALEKFKRSVGAEGIEVSVVGNWKQAANEIKTSCINEQNTANNEKWRENLKELLGKLGVTSHLMGYDMLFAVMEKLAESPNKTEAGHLKVAYEYAAKICGKSFWSVERNIRTLMNVVCNYNTNWELSQIMGVPINDNMKITNSTFIALLAQTIFK